MTAAALLLCRHCHARRATRPHGLCLNCHTDRGVRGLYPSDSIYARRGVGADFRGVPVPPPCPTPAAPGSAEKLAVLEERAILNVGLWHPEDGWARLPATATNASDPTLAKG